MLIATALIYHENGRALVDGNVAALAQSMQEIGLLSPILVKPAKHHRDGVLSDCFDIVAGRHRFAAARSLGWTQIECTVVNLSALHLELAELDENLMRENLSPAELAIALPRRKEIYETLYPETKQHVAGGHGKHKSASDNLSFAEQTATAIGKNPKTVERAVNRGNALKMHLLDIKGTSLDKGVELDALTALPEDERAALVSKAKSGQNVSARRALYKVADEPVDDEQATERQLAALTSAWNKAGPEARQKFRDIIDAPIMDARFA